MVFWNLKSGTNQNPHITFIFKLFEIIGIELLTSVSLIKVFWLQMNKYKTVIIEILALNSNEFWAKVPLIYHMIWMQCYWLVLLNIGQNK